MKLMKFLRVYSAILLLLALTVSIDLGFNYLGSTLPELQDGTGGYNSLLQSSFGLLEHMGISTRADFFYAFRLSVFVTAGVFAQNIFLSFVKGRK